MFSPLRATVQSNANSRISIGSLDRGGVWAAPVETGDSTKFAPGQIFFRGKFWLAFVANDASNDILVCKSDNGLQSTQPPVRLRANAGSAPGLAVVDGELYIVFANTNSTLVAAKSGDGQSWQIRSIGNNPTNRATPSGVGYRFGRVLVASVDKAKSQIVCNDLRIDPFDIDNGWNSWYPTNLPPVNGKAPALAIFNNKAWLAYLTPDTNELMVRWTADYKSWSEPIAVNQASQTQPFMTIFENKLWMSFVANNGSNSILVCSSADGLQWSGNTPIGQASPGAAALSCLFPYTGEVRPKYQIVTVVYAPPGTSSGKSTSQVEYGAASTLGTTTSNTNSFKSGVGVSASVSFLGSGAGAEFDFASTSSDSATLEVKKSTGWKINVTGPAQDGINHDYDIFYLWLNPLLNVAVDPNQDVNFELAADGDTMIVQYVYALWLKNPDLMPPGLKRTLEKAGLTQEDYTQILSTNPFTSGSRLDSNRFLPTTQSFPYLPPISPNDTPPTFTYTLQNTLARTATKTAQTQYSVGFNVTAGFEGIFTASLKTSTTLEWTNLSSSSSNKSSTQSATAIVGGPSFNYAGPTDVLVYWDTVFSSFVFKFPEADLSLSGQLTDTNGAPIVSEAVTLKAGDREATTMTDARGGFRFYGVPEDSGEVSVRGKKFTLPLGSPETVQAIKL